MGSPSRASLPMSDMCVTPSRDMKTYTMMALLSAKDGSTAVMAVPSAVISVEHNYLLNPRHPNFYRIQIGTPQPFEFDS